MPTSRSLTRIHIDRHLRFLPFTWQVHVDMHDFIPEGCPAPAKPRVHLLYRPGHYVRRRWALD